MEVELGPKPHVCFEVEKVIGISSDGSYQVQWAPVWVSKFHLVGCEHLIQEYLQQQLQQQSEKHFQQYQQHQRSLEEDFEDTPNLMKQPSQISMQTVDHPSSQQDELGTYSEHDQCSGEEENVGLSHSSVTMPFSKFDCSNSQKVSQQFDEPERSETKSETVSVKIEEEETIEISDCSPLSFSKEGSVSLNNDELRSDMLVDDIPENFSCTHLETNNNCLKCIEGTTVASFQTFSNATLVEKKYTCSFCNQQLRSKTHLRVHLRSHTGERPHVCHYCEKGFTRKDYLKTHLLTHTGEQPFACKQCGRTFTQKGTLNRHQQHVHSSTATTMAYDI